jgi:hypothetical protein
MVFCAVSHGKHAKSSVAISDDAARSIVNIKGYARSNDWKSIQCEYDKINWKSVDKPGLILAEISKILKTNAAAEDLRREIKTRYSVLREKGDADLADDIVQTPIPVVMFPKIEISRVAVPVITVPIVEVDQIEVDRVAFSSITESVLLAKNRYNRMTVYDSSGNKIAPMPGSVLWYERQAVIKAIEAGGDYDKLWDAYNEHLKQAIGRRINLKRKR